MQRASRRRKLSPLLKAAAAFRFARQRGHCSYVSGDRGARRLTCGWQGSSLLGGHSSERGVSYVAECARCALATASQSTPNSATVGRAGAPCSKNCGATRQSVQQVVNDARPSLQWVQWGVAHAFLFTTPCRHRDSRSGHVLQLRSHWILLQRPTDRRSCLYLRVSLSVSPGPPSKPIAS
jgi:hypothetical protein